MRQAIITAGLVLGGLWLWQGPVRAYKERHRCDGLSEDVLSMPPAKLKLVLAQHDQAEINYCVEHWPARPMP